MTSRDVRDILQLPAAGPSDPSAAAAKKKARPKSKAPRGDGITRELYALIGDNAPPLALAALKKPKFKERLKETAQQKAAKWRRNTFANEARSDGLKLKHWIRLPEGSDAEQDQTYTFSKYNTTSNPFSYSTEEYIHHLRDDDWTREETDYLFGLLQTYDLRFTIVMDRYDFPGKERTIEALKARYYSICQKLIAARPSTGTEEERAKEISSYNFDPVRENERKAHVASLIWRSPAQIAEEDFLYIESRRLEQNALRFSQERDALMSTLDGMLYQLVKSQADISLGVGGSGLPMAGPGPSSSAVAAAKKARRSDAALFDGADLVEPPGGGKKVSKAQLASDALNCVYRFDGPAPLNQPPVTLRSSRVAQPKSSLAPRITSLLAELGMPTMGRHLVMPTRGNVARYEELLNACATLVELKRQVERNESEIEVQKKKKAALGGVTAPAAPTEAEASEPPKSARSASAALKRSPSVSSTASGPRERKRSRRA